MNVQILVLAKAPVPGRVKTRLCPPCTPAQAAAVAAAALADTIGAVTATDAAERVLVLSGQYRAPAGWRLIGQRGGGLGERLAHGYADAARAGLPAILVGMDSPQLTPAHLTDAAAALGRADAVIGPALDGGWWALGLREPADATVLCGVPMSTPDTARRTVAALRRRGLAVAHTGPLRDVDTAEDARIVAAEAPTGRFAAAVRRHVPIPVAESRWTP